MCEYVSRLTACTKKVAIAGGEGDTLCLSPIVKKSIIAPSILCSIIGWSVWSTSCVDAPIHRVRERLRTSRRKIADAQTAKFMLQILCGLSVSPGAFVICLTLWKSARELRRWRPPVVVNASPSVAQSSSAPANCVAPTIFRPNANAPPPGQTGSALSLGIVKEVSCIATGNGGAETAGAPCDSESPIDALGEKDLYVLRAH